MQVLLGSKQIVRDDQARGRGLLGVERLDDDAVLEGLDVDRHLSTSTFHVGLNWTRETDVPRTLGLAVMRAVAGIARHCKRWHPHGESANPDVSTPPERVPAQASDEGAQRD